MWAKKRGERQPNGGTFHFGGKQLISRTDRGTISKWSNIYWDEMTIIDSTIHVNGNINNDHCSRIHSMILMAFVFQCENKNEWTRLLAGDKQRINKFELLFSI